MADNVPITAGSGTTVGTDERTINSVAVQVQRVVDQGGTALANAQVSVGTSAVTAAAARDTRKRVTILADPDNTGTIYVGVATVTTANGFKLIAGASHTLAVTALVQAIASAAGQKVFVTEEYDA